MAEPTRANLARAIDLLTPGYWSAESIAEALDAAEQRGRDAERLSLPVWSLTATEAAGVEPALARLARKVARWSRVGPMGWHALRDHSGIIVASYEPWPSPIEAPRWIFEGDLYATAELARDAAEAEAAKRGWTVKP